MTDKIFKSIFTAALCVLLASLALIMGALYEYFSGLQRHQLAAQTVLAAQGVENEGEGFFAGLETKDFRVTWIAPDGTVLYDTDSDPAAMENHADREEFLEAVETGEGESSRVSATLSEKTEYVARRLADGSVVRVSASHYTVPTLIMGIITPLLAIVILSIVLAAVLASRLSRRIVGPLNALDLDSPLSNDAYEELTPLLTKINYQQRQIHEQLETLRLKRDEFAAVTGSMSEGLILLDERGYILSMNPAAIAISGAEGDCAGQDILTVDRSPEMRAILEKTASGGRGEALAERGGREYQMNASPVYSEGVLCGTVVLAFDVTDRIGAERLRREFTANVSHELKTPLQSIMGAAELMEQGLVKQEDEKSFCARIRGDAARLVALVDDIIRLSKLDEGEAFPKENVSLRELADDVAESLAPAASKADVTVSVTGDAGEVNGVRQLLWEIVWNLCDNAVRYNKPGGRVDVDIKDSEDGVRLVVRDTGIGIPEEHRSRVFERFYRVDKSHSRQTGGTGLGLSIVKHAAAYHGAEIELKSREGEGTEITVVFPKG